MRKYIFIAIGGMVGAMLRYVIKNIHIYPYKGSIPINTLLINISGSILIALVLTIALEVFDFDADLRLGIATGFLGAYTTFSTLCKETVHLMEQGNYYSAIVYIVLSTMLGLGAVYLGVILARNVIAIFVNKQNESNKAE
jgi:CrcB protein